MLPDRICRMAFERLFCLEWPGPLALAFNPSAGAHRTRLSLRGIHFSLFCVGGVPLPCPFAFCGLPARPAPAPFNPFPTLYPFRTLCVSSRSGNFSVVLSESLFGFGDGFMLDLWFRDDVRASEAEPWEVECGIVIQRQGGLGQVRYLNERRSTCARKSKSKKKGRG
jgi:hypothetical protein